MKSPRVPQGPKFQDRFPEIFAEYNASRNPADRGSLCHAPSVNLNFDQLGFATACCYNRKYVLGTYPAKSIQQIWEGARTVAMRELLKEGDLSKGCDLCEHQLQARNFAGLRARAFDGADRMAGAKPSPVPMPRIMEFEISNVCNLECIMCNGFFSSSIRRNREKLEPMKNVYDDAFVEQLRPFLPYLMVARFLGGEPFLNPVYYKIWEAIIEINPGIDSVITTNATILNQKGRDLIWKLKPGIVVSCDALDKETYESIRVNAEFETFMENVGEFLRLSRSTGKAMAMAVCPMTKNWTSMPDILRFCNDQGACIGFNTVVWPPELSLRSFPRKKLLHVLKFLEEGCAPELKDADAWWVRFNYGVYQDMLKQVRLWSQENG